MGSERSAAALSLRHSLPIMPAERKDGLWTVCDRTVVEIEFNASTVRVGPDTAPVPATLLDRGACHVITAWNPDGELRPEPENSAAHERLVGELESIGARWVPATGSARDGSWSEPGVCAFGLGRERAVELGARYGQLAIFEVNAAGLAVIPCRVRHA